MAESRFPLADLPDPALEQALRELGQQVAFPPAPDLTARVLGRLGNQPPTPLPQPRGRQLLWLAAALLMVLLGTLLLVPGVRTAIADRLGLSGVQIRWVDEVPTPSPVGTPLMLGRQVTLEEARAAVDFPILLSSTHGLAAPNEVYLLGLAKDAMVSFVYPESSLLPESDVIGVGALLTQFRGSTERNLIEKGLRDDDSESPTRLEALTVNGEPGFWISGAPHSVFLVCHDDGDCREERYRLAGNVLLWEKDGVTLRLESALSREESLAIAESIQPPR